MVRWRVSPPAGQFLKPRGGVHDQGDQADLGAVRQEGGTEARRSLPPRLAHDPLQSNRCLVTPGLHFGPTAVPQRQGPSVVECGHGLVAALFDSYATFLKYARLWEKTRAVKGGR